ncbi:MAG: BlaI/MecI/CopY family transcriptional regulator [Planctomycetaceae bacterium]|nr:BlaI/MecI/CopY family transcriptional regulator [Planctomycetaceae bacterium]
MTDRPGLSRGETEVLKALWQIGKGAVGEIHAAVAPERHMDYSTVQTYVRRLESKGYITATRVGRNKIYRAGVKRAAVLRQAVGEFVDLLFDGQLLPMVKHLVDSREISANEIEDLKKLVDTLQKEQTDD